MVKNEEKRQVYISDISIEDALQNKAKRWILFSYKGGECAHVDVNYEHDYLSGNQELDDILYARYFTEIPEVKIRPMNYWELLKWQADNPTLLVKHIMTGNIYILTISVFHYHGNPKNYMYTENTGKEPKEADWKPLPEVEVS